MPSPAAIRLVAVCVWHASYPTQLIEDYLPSTLDHEDYPELIAAGETVDTVGVGAVLIGL